MSYAHWKFPVTAAALERGAAEAAPAVRAWRVLHACDHVPAVLAAVESQSAAGMKPYVVTPAGVGGPEDFLAAPPKFTPGSLLTMWNDVRGWRRCIAEAEASARERGFDLVHAHTFASGMAAVRNCACVVYGVTRFVEEAAVNSDGLSQPDTSWLGRSFRVAEQFVLTRAGAVVVHGSAMRRGALERGALEENLFQIPEPLSAQALEVLEAAAAVADPEDHATTFLAVDFRTSASNALPQELELLLQAFAIVRQEPAFQGARLLLPVSAELVTTLFERARGLEISDAVHPLGANLEAEAFLEAHVVIAGSGPSAEPAQMEISSSLNGAMRALIAGRAVLAADCDANRDVTPQGRGLLWYRADEAKDLASRAMFLAGNPDLRRAMAASGRRMLLETRSPEAIGRAYDRAYQRAWLRRRSGGLASGTAVKLEPITAH